MSTAISNPQPPANEWESILPTIRNMYARDASDPEFKIFCETARALGLNPILRQIWCVKNKNKPEQPAQVYASRDGLVTIAHRSGQFDGMESGTKTNENGEMVGWCRIWRKDMSHPFYVEVLRKEYDTGKNLWESKPATMTEKVAQAHAFKLAFDICGVYTPDEMGRQGEEQNLAQESPGPMREVTYPAEMIADAPTPKPTDGNEQFVGDTNDEMHCYLCGKDIDPSREGLVSRREFGRYYCMDHLVSERKAAAVDVTPKPAPKKGPSKPSPVDRVKEDLAALEKRDQPSTSSAMADEIARIQAEQDAIEQKQKKAPLPPLCAGCGKSVTANEMSASLKVCPETLCSECLSLMNDEPQKPAWGQT